ncbi:hypothetical protein NL50_01290 [Clostridium acetobutylicum]|nr:hypothetical protein NL50_01290 [Clostridium acetobutylicum]
MNFRKSNIKILISTVLMSCAAFGCLIMAENKIINSSGKKEVIIASKDIKQGTAIDKSSLKKVEYYRECVNSDSVTNMEYMGNKYALENIYKGEVISKKRISDKNDDLKPFLKENEKEISIPLSKFNNDTFIGTLREGDIVDIVHTSVVNEKAEDEVEAKGLKVIGAVDSQGRFLKEQDKNILAASLVFLGSDEEFIKISKDFSIGYFTIARCSKVKK